MSITFELYRKSSSQKVLKEGPENARFWIKQSVKRVLVHSSSESYLRGECYKFVRDVLGLKPNVYLRVLTYHYWSSRFRTSYWAWVSVANKCYKCHAECAFMPLITEG